MKSRLNGIAVTAWCQLLAVLIAFGLAGCAKPRYPAFGPQSSQSEVTPRKVGDSYQFKTWPAAPITYSIQLRGVTKTSAILGPDFSVQYFTFAPEASMALYNGGFPQKRADNIESRFDAPFGEKKTEWTISRQEEAFRAETFVRDDDSIWHVIVIAPTDQRVRAVIDQLSSFSRRGKATSK